MIYCKDKDAEEKIKEMEKTLRRREFKESYIRDLVAMQKGELGVSSQYYKGNIAEGNWSLIVKDEDIEKLNKGYDEEDSYLKVGSIDVSKRKKDAEYEYIFIPSYYAVKMMILYYMKNPKQAEKIFGLKNAVVGGLDFIYKYVGGDYKDERIDLSDLIEEIIDYERELKHSDDFINEIINLLNNFYGKDLILERRIKNYNESKDNWFTIDFYTDEEFLLSHLLDYQILGHKDIKKDFQHLQKVQREKAKEKINKTPKHPNNDCPEDSEKLSGNLKGWFSQRISKKDRLVYKKDTENKIVYIATVCGHYDKAPNRTKSTDAYRSIED